MRSGRFRSPTNFNRPTATTRIEPRICFNDMRWAHTVRMPHRSGGHPTFSTSRPTRVNGWTNARGMAFTIFNQRRCAHDAQGDGDQRTRSFFNRRRATHKKDQRDERLMFQRTGIPGDATVFTMAHELLTSTFARLERCTQTEGARYCNRSPRSPALFQHADVRRSERTTPNHRSGRFQQALSVVVRGNTSAAIPIPNGPWIERK